MATNRRTSQRVTLLMLVLASITILTLDYHGEASRAIGHARNGALDALSPFQRGIAAALHPVGDVIAGAFHYGALEQENARLQQQVGAAGRQLAEANAEQSAADEVLRLSKLPFLSGIETTSAEVISGPTSNFEFTVEIDRGTDDGVGPDMPVVADNGRIGGLIGRVESASSHEATVLLLTDSRYSIDVALGSGSTWVASGQGRNEALSLTEPSGTATSPTVGALVYTSALGGGAYPAGIPLGTVSSVRPSPGGLSSSVLVRPLVDLDTLQYVAVLEWMQPG